MVQKKTSKAKSKAKTPVKSVAKVQVKPVVKTQKKVLAIKPTTALQTVQPNPVPVVANVPVEKRENYPVLSFVLFICALIIWFFVGNLFMQLAVQENFCKIRYWGVSEPKGEVVAVVGDEEIYMSEIKDYVKSIPQLESIPFEVIYPQLLDTVVTSRVLRKAAEKADIESKPEVLQALQLAHDQIMAQAYLDQKLKSLMTRDRLYSLYQAEMADWVSVPEIHAHHIVVKTEAEAKGLRDQLNNGASFTALANQYSLDKSSPDGDLGYFTEDMMIPEFGRAVFALENGQLSEPIETAFGWHIVRVDDRRMTQQPSFDSVKEDLKKVLIEGEIARVLEAERQAIGVQIKKPKL